MKRLLGLGLLVLVVFFGCDAFGSIFNPVIGTWEATVLGVTITNTYHTMGTFSESTTLLGIGTTKTGDWVSDGDVITRTWPDGSTDVNYYTVSSDKQQMTVSATPGGISITYVRM